MHISTNTDRTAYTDGAASGNPGPGGWAFELDGELVSGGVKMATNNEMELFAIYQAIEHCSPYSNLTIYTDSNLAIGFLAKRWKSKSNPALTELIENIKVVAWTRKIELNFVHVKGHADNPGNIRVDRAAYHESQALKRKRALERGY